LDEAAKRDVETAIQTVVRNHGLTCVMVTHDLAQAVRVAQRALLLEAGRIVREGSVNEVLHA
jgi:putative ABC transport system ATP-binding protein